MHVGLCDDAPDLMSLVAQRNPLVAARCVGVARLHDKPSGRALQAQWSAMLGDSQSRRRWVASQCLLHAGDISEEAGARLVDLALSDPEVVVRQVAMHALSGCACAATIECLVASLVAYDHKLAAAGFASNGAPPMPDPGASLWRLRSTQVVEALVQRWSSSTSEHGRTRVESLIATMDPDFVAEALARIERPEAEQIIRALPEWNYIGFLESRKIRDDERVRALAEASARDCRVRLREATVESLQHVLQSGTGEERAIALELLNEHGAVTVDQLFDAVLRDPSLRVESQAESILQALPQSVVSLRWEALMNETAWTVRFHASTDLEEDLVRFSTRWSELSRSLSGGGIGPDQALDYPTLSERSIHELALHGISADDFRCAPVDGGWLLEPVGENYRGGYYLVRTENGLAVIDAKLRPKLAVLGARLGDRAMPALERLFRENPPYARAALIEAWGMIGSDAAMARLAEHLNTESLDLGVVVAIGASRHPAATALLLNALEVMQVSEVDVDADAEARIRELTDRLVDRAAFEALHRLISALLDSAGGSRRVVAAQVLLAHARKTQQPFEDLAIRACSDANPRVRIAGMELLAKTQGPAGRAILLQSCIDEPVHGVWMVACESFRRACSDEDLLQLRDARNQADPCVHARVIGALAATGDDSVIPDLLEALNDPAIEVQRLAADGLRKLGACGDSPSDLVSPTRTDPVHSPRGEPSRPPSLP